jgi:hypothetical protein
MLTSKWLIVIGALCLAHLPRAEAAPEWVVLDDTFQIREADRSSLQRHGPWAEFTQRWVARKNGKLIDDATIIERMAVNCLTGAYGQTQYPSTDLKTNQPLLKTHSLAEVEHAQPDEGRLLLDNNSTQLGRALISLACTCPLAANPGAAANSQSVTESELKSVYDRYVAQDMTKIEFHLSYLRVSSKEAGLAAVAKLKAGASFEAVFDEYASPFDARTFPHGDLGSHLETEWPLEEVRFFRSMKVGEFSLAPSEGIYGWGVYKLQSMRTVPAPSFSAIHSRLGDFVTRAHACGWPL